MHTTFIRVYLEDTDAGDIVYHANYLRFAERARTEFFRSIGFSHRDMMAGKDGNEALLFAIASLDIKFQKSAFLDDVLQIKTCVKNITKARLCLEQTFWREKLQIAQLNCVLACVKKTGRPVGIPPSIIEGFQEKFL